MKCVICKNGETQDKTTTVTLESKGKTFVFKEVPARICQNCGEQYVEDIISRRLFDLMKSSEKIGTELNISKFVAA
jgi:YgiT-type zinc finger domain-containing protein